MDPVTNLIKKHPELPVWLLNATCYQLHNWYTITKISTLAGLGECLVHTVFYKQFMLSISEYLACLIVSIESYMYHLRVYVYQAQNLLPMDKDSFSGETFSTRKKSLYTFQIANVTSCFSSDNNVVTVQ